MSTRRLQVVLDLDLGRYSGRLTQAGRQMQTFQGQANAAGRGVNNLGRSFNNLNGNLGAPLQKLREYTLVLGNLRFAMIAVQGLAVGWIWGMMKQSAEVERLTVLLKGLSKETTEAGRNKDAQKSLKEMFDLSRRTGFEVKQLTDAMVKFRSGGLDTAVFKVANLANAVANFGGTGDTMHRASIAIQQMAGKGVISMEELRQQLGEAVPSAMSIMAFAAKKSVAEFTKEVSKGTVDAKTHLKLMLDDMGRLYGDAGMKMANTFNGQIEQVKTNMMELSTYFTGLGEKEGLFAGATKSLKQFNDALQSGGARDFMKGLGGTIASITASLTTGIKAMIEWREQIGFALHTVAVLIGAILVKNIAGWAIAQGAAFASMAGTLIPAVNTMSGSLVNLTRTVVGMGSQWQSAAGASVAAARLQLGIAQGVAAAANAEAQAHGRNVAALRAEQVARQQLSNSLRLEAMAHRAALVQGQATGRFREANTGRYISEAAAVNNLAMAENRLAATNRLLGVTNTQLAATEAALTAALAAETMALNTAGAATQALTVKKRIYAVAANIATAATRAFTAVMAVATNPIMMVAGALIYAANQAGYFESKANAAAAAARNMMTAMGGMAEMKAMQERVNQIDEELAFKEGNYGKMGLRTILNDNGVQDAYSKREQERARLLQTMRSRTAQGNVGAERGREYNQSRGRAADDRWNAEQSAKFRPRYEALRERGDFQGAEALRREFDNAKLSRDRRQLGAAAGALEAARKKNDPTAIAFWEQRVEALGAKLDETRSSMQGVDAAAAGAAGGAGGGGGKGGLPKFAGAVAGAEGQVAQLEARMNGSNGALAKFNAELAGGKYAGMTKDQIGRMQAALTKIDQIKGAAKGASEGKKDARAAAAAQEQFENLFGGAAGRLAELNDELVDGKGNLAKFEAQIKAGKFDFLNPAQVEAMREVMKMLDEAEKKKDNKKLFDGLDGDLAQAKSEANSLWTSFNMGTMEADKRLAQINARFADKLIGLSGPELEQAKQKIDEIVKTINEADAAEIAETWRLDTQQILESLMTEEEARRANYEAEYARRLSLIQLTEQGTQRRMQLEQQLANWKAAMDQRMLRSNEHSVIKMARDWAKLGANIQNVLQGAIASFVDGMFEADFNFGKFVIGIVKNLIKVILTAMIAYAILSAIGMANNSAGQPVSFGDFMKGQISSGIGMGGGQGTDIGFAKKAAPSTPPIAPKYHTGGWLGQKPLGANEVPFIGKRGELILTEDQQGAIGRRLNGAPPTVTVNVINNSGQDVDAEQGEPQFDGANMIVDVVIEAMGRDGRMREAVRGVK